MPRYFFDLDEGGRHIHDDEGSELPDVQHARDEAVGLLPAIVTARLPDGEAHEFVATVRTADGATVFRATLRLTMEWIGPADQPSDL